MRVCEIQFGVFSAQYSMCCEVRNVISRCLSTNVLREHLLTVVKTTA